MYKKISKIFVQNKKLKAKKKQKEPQKKPRIKEKPNKLRSNKKTSK